MKDFLDKHRDKITGTLSCPDRIILKGHLPLDYPAGMESFLFQQGIRIADFKSFAPCQAERLKDHAKQVAALARRPFRYLDRPERKDDRARAIAALDGITEGLVCVLSVIEPCRTFKVVPGKRRPHLESAKRKCLFIYFYYLHPVFGLIHVRIQTWFPFLVQVYVNGHEWLARRMDEQGIKYRAIDNAFSWIEDPEAAQRLADRLPKETWLPLLDELACAVNPLLRDLLQGLRYYWVIDQAEYATDIMFKDREALQSLYPRLLRHASLCFSAEDVLTFLGRRLHHAFAGEVLNDCKKRWPGARIKHRMKENWLKMYDKRGCVLRIETVINRPYEFRIWRRANRKGQPVMGWHPMLKRIGHFPRYTEVSRIANYRYLNALAVVDDPAEAYRSLHRIAEPAQHNGRNVRGFNPAARDDIKLFTAVMAGDNAVMGLRNGDVRKALGLASKDAGHNRKASARVSRLLKRLHVHGFLAKIPRSRRWRVTKAGYAFMSFAIRLHEEHFPAQLMQRDRAA